MPIPIRVNQNGRKTILLATSQNQSVLAEVSQGDVNPMAYTAYGHLSALTSTHLGFNGELREPHTHWYLLGNGYRAYNPVLMRFHNPDKLSPFGAGGLNSYMYCIGDPINHRDPTGRIAITVFLSQLSGVVGGSGSLGGIASSLYNGARFSRQGLLALGTGTTGVLLGAAVIAVPGSVIAPVLVGGSLAAGVATITLARRIAATARTVGFDRPPAYKVLFAKEPPPYETLDLPPAYSPPRARNTIAPTHSTTGAMPQHPAQIADSARDHETLLNPTALETTRMGELPQLQYINETNYTTTKIRTDKP